MGAPRPSLPGSSTPPRPADQAGATSSEPWQPFGEDTSSAWFSRNYVSGGFGLYLQDDLDGRNIAGTPSTIEFDTGFAGQVALGTYLGQDFRLEAEAGYRVADYDQVKVAGASLTADNNLKIATGIVNLLYDIHLGSSFVPYFGAGLGFAQLDGGDAGTGATRTKGKDTTELALQGIVGVGYEYDRTWSWILDTRYLGTTDDDVTATAITLNVRYNL